MFDPDGLARALEGGKRLVVFLHDNPDPDAIAAGWLLARLAEARGLKSLIVFGGRLGRAENRAMVKLLRIPLRPLVSQPLRHLKTDRYALVDSQPGSGNNSFPADRATCHVVLDHHAGPKRVRAVFSDVRPDEGCTSAMALGYFDQAGLTLDPDLATAVSYAVISETQDLGREATRVDREAYQRVFPLVRLNVLGRIRHPVRTRAYYQTILRALEKVQVSRHTCVCHIGLLDEAEVVAEVADFLAAMERISWCLVTGWTDGQMVLSVRTTRTRGRAGHVMRKTLERLGKGGGHGMIAGGAAPCVDLTAYEAHCAAVTERFLKQLRRKTPINLRPLAAERPAPPAQCPEPAPDQAAASTPKPRPEPDAG